jgi:hypothetical protein
MTEKPSTPEYASTVYAFIVTPEDTGTHTRIEPTVTGIQAHLDDGWLEGIYPHTGTISWHAYIDEEGKLKGLPINVFGTALARTIGWLADDVLVGPVVFLGDHPEGEESDVPQAVLDAAAALAAADSA